MKKFLVEMPDDLHESLKIEAIKRRTTMSKVVIQAIERDLLLFLKGGETKEDVERKMD